MKTIKVGVVGATGYAGSEVCRLIAGPSPGGAGRHQLRQL